MATTRTRRIRTPENPALAVLRWVWAAVLTLLFVAAGLALAFVGAVVVVVGVEELLASGEAGDAIEAVLVAGMGLAGVAVASGLVFWLRPRAVPRLSGRTAPLFPEDSVVGGLFGDGGDGGGCDGGGSC